MKYFLFPLIFLFLTSLEVEAQLVPSVSNVLRYGKGKKTLGDINEDFKYFENLTDARLQFLENFTAGFRLLYDVPSELGTEFRGIKRRFLEFDNTNFYARAGDFSQLYSRGLALNLFENRGLGYDTWMDGITAKYKHNYFNISAIYGTLEFEDSIEIARHEIHKLRAGNIEIIPLRNLAVGLVYIYSKSSFDLYGANTEAEIGIPSFYTNFNFGNFTLLIDYSSKETLIKNTDQKSIGFGYYGAFSYNKDGLGMTMDYKNYSFDERDPFEKSDITRPTRMMPYQNPPIVMKEHSYTLLTRAIHEVDFNDETGLQIEVLKAFGESTELNLNASLSSRHSFYTFDQNTFVFKKQERNGDFLPSPSKEYSPYWELFGEVVHYFNESTYMKLALARRDKTFYDEFFGGLNNHVIKSTIVPAQINHTFSSFYSIEGQAEYEKVYDNFNEQQKHYNNYLFTVINTFISQLTLTFRYEITSNEFDVSERKDWFTIESGFRINQGNTIVASYGRERGGQVCSNGVCRYIQPFEGFRFSLITNI